MQGLLPGKSPATNGGKGGKLKLKALIHGNAKKVHAIGVETGVSAPKLSMASVVNKAMIEKLRVGRQTDLWAPKDLEGTEEEVDLACIHTLLSEDLPPPATTSVWRDRRFVDDPDTTVPVGLSRLTLQALNKLASRQFERCATYFTLALVERSCFVPALVGYAAALRDAPWLLSTKVKGSMVEVLLGRAAAAYKRIADREQADYFLEYMELPRSMGVELVAVRALVAGMVRGVVRGDHRRATEQYKIGVGLGLPAAAFNLAISYFEGRGVLPDSREAMRILHVAADAGHGAACANLGAGYMRGDGVARSVPRALDYYRKGVAQGDATAQYNLGQLYRHGKGVERSYEEAVRLLELAAFQEHHDAMTDLAYMLVHGHGVPAKNAKAGFALYKAASEIGSIRATAGLGVCYRKGIGTKPDLVQALMAYSRAATAGNTHAIFCLGVCFLRGYGVERDQERGFDLLKEASEAGHGPATFKLAKCYEFGRGTEVDPAEAMKTYMRAAELGEPEVQYRLAVSYRTGVGVPQSDRKSAALLAEAAATHHRAATVDYGYCLRHGIGTAPDESAGVKLYEKGAGLGVPTGMWNMAAVKYHGIATDKSHKEAVKHMKDAAEKNHAEACFQLGIRYRNANGVAFNPIKAHKLLKKASKRGHKEARTELHKVLCTIM